MTGAEEISDQVRVLYGLLSSVPPDESNLPPSWKKCQRGTSSAVHVAIVPIPVRGEG